MPIIKIKEFLVMSKTAQLITIHYERKKLYSFEPETYTIRFKNITYHIPIKKQKFQNEILSTINE